MDSLLKGGEKDKKEDANQPKHMSNKFESIKAYDNTIKKR